MAATCIGSVQEKPNCEARQTAPNAWSWVFY